MVYDPEIVALWSWCSSIYIFVEVLTGSLFYWVEGPSPKSRIPQDPAVSPITVHSWAFQTRLASLPCISKTRDLSTQDRPNPPYSEVSPPIGRPHYDACGELNASSFIVSTALWAFLCYVLFILYYSPLIFVSELLCESMNSQGGDCVSGLFLFHSQGLQNSKGSMIVFRFVFFFPQSSSTFYWCPSLQSLLHSWSFWSFS